MSKKTDPTLAYEKASSELIEKIEDILKQAVSHYYPMKIIAATYNEVFGKNQLPTSCSSCNRSWVRALKTWYVGYVKYKNGINQLTTQSQSDVTSILITTLAGNVRVYDDLTAAFEPRLGSEDGEDGVYPIDQNSKDRLIINEGFATLILDQYNIDDYLTPNDTEAQKELVARIIAKDLVDPTDPADKIDTLKTTVVKEDPEDEDSKEKPVRVHKTQSEIEAEVAQKAKELDAEVVGKTFAAQIPDKAITHTIELTDGRIIDLNDKGVSTIEGKRIKPGTYDMKGGGKVSITVRGVANIKYDENELI